MTPFTKGKYCSNAPDHGAGKSNTSVAADCRSDTLEHPVGVGMVARDGNRRIEGDDACWQTPFSPSVGANWTE